MKKPTILVLSLLLCAFIVPVGYADEETEGSCKDLRGPERRECMHNQDGTQNVRQNNRGPRMEAKTSSESSDDSSSSSRMMKKKGASARMARFEEWKSADCSTLSFGKRVACLSKKMNAVRILKRFEARDKLLACKELAENERESCMKDVREELRAERDAIRKERKERAKQLRETCGELSGEEKKECALNLRKEWANGSSSSHSSTSSVSSSSSSSESSSSSSNSSSSSSVSSSESSSSSSESSSSSDSSSSSSN